MIRKTIAAVFIIVFLVALGGNTSQATSFGTNAAKAGGVVVKVGISAAMTLATALSSSGSGSKTPAPAPSSTAPAAKTPPRA